MKYLSLFICLLLVPALPCLSGPDENQYEKGLSFYRSNQLEKAFDAFSAAVRSDPENADAWNNRGAVQYRQKKYHGAISDYTRALALAPSSFNGLKNRGIAWLESGRPERAVADFSRALGLVPESADVLISRGIAQYRLGRFGNALDDFLAAVQLAPGDPDTCNQLAWMLSTCPDKNYRDGSQALEMARKAVAFRPGINTLDTLAAAYAEAGDIPKALAHQEQLMILLKENGISPGPGQKARLAAYRNGKTWYDKAFGAPAGPNGTFNHIQPVLAWEP